MFNLKSLVLTLVAAGNVLAVESPFGFASGTTGGNSAAQAVPTSAAPLKSWPEDNVTRNILLNRTYDFTDTELSLNGNGWCGSNPLDVTVTYKKAGTSGIRVNSNKAILGKDTSGWIKGKGLLLSGVSNALIQNIRISDLNPQYARGGDALYIDNSSKVWPRAGGSGTLANTANSGILSSFTDSVVKRTSVKDPADVVTFVTANAGLGKVN